MSTRPICITRLATLLTALYAPSRRILVVNSSSSQTSAIIELNISEVQGMPRAAMSHATTDNDGCFGVKRKGSRQMLVSTMPMAVRQASRFPRRRESQTPNEIAAMLVKIVSEPPQPLSHEAVCLLPEQTR